MRFVELAEETADLSTQAALERLTLTRDNMNVDASRANRGGNLTADEAPTHNNDLLRGRDPLEEAARIPLRAHIENIGIARAGDWKFLDI